MLNVGCKNKRNIVPYTKKLQDPEVEHIITNFSQDLTCECVKPGKNAKNQRTKSPESPKHHNEPELLRLTFKQLNEFNLTAIPSDGDAGFVLMLDCDVSALHEEIAEGKGYNEITLRDINVESGPCGSGRCRSASTKRLLN